ncbi:hypothetical protein LTSEINV_3598 [Salmonella enterica subsp. enterica serovar Inverness str. R8-3668]|uniref:Uncharacterized protein n=4 Tax=Salmonella enterica I TaxID=59201 RepID=M7RDB9_SALDU|nr:hypothetical protein SPAB_00685 [Salmonella enterica subsp. enterica serovar Paratyphi B str. SPB7]AET53013.1 hypothetical protein SPUL_0594 [Salmonella enterica subsp. enterica serovar Gallinarum/Pullorum str. RKS5078]AGU63514.1 hypothetical protein SPUCDC_0594 [Salmonella enterica subsp. enterica serovar Gallinarum/Pullorum str. CDC1983-67]APT78263.1 hypothetical protein GW13_PRO1387 [Salmonella enterica subsp. enterica serovar Cerro]EDZ36156.1 hypothetical protein SeH_A2811 [Salmonella en
MKFRDGRPGQKHKNSFWACIKCLKLSAKAKHNSVKNYLFTSP